jgi:hypothetical protein
LGLFPRSLIAWLRIGAPAPHPEKRHATQQSVTQAHFDDFFKLLPKRTDSPRSWTIDFAACLQKALEEARPHREQAAVLDAQAKQLDDAIKEKKKAKTVSENADERSPPKATQSQHKATSKPFARQPIGNQ